MSADVRRRLTQGRNKASVSRSKEQNPTFRASKVLAERNQAVVAVGAWVENGEEFLQNPSVSVNQEVLCFKKKNKRVR